MQRRRVILFGANGLLGRELTPALTAAGWQARGLDRRACDITSGAQVTAAVRDFGADVVVNLAAFTRVDDAEREQQAAFAVNRDGARVVAEAARAHGAQLLHISTDYVFDGQKRSPYSETDALAPLGVYARSKAEGEAAVQASGASAWIVRTGELYGDGGGNFFGSIVRAARQGRALRVVDDQWVSPTWTRELADQLIALLEAAPAPGVYHATAEGQTTWFEAAQTALATLHLEAPVQPVRSHAYGSPTPRPLYSVLAPAALRALGLYRMRPWQEALREWLSSTGEL